MPPQSGRQVHEGVLILYDHIHIYNIHPANAVDKSNTWQMRCDSPVAFSCTRPLLRTSLLQARPDLGWVGTTKP